MNSKNIFIVGAMGSGKSTIGKLLAKKLKRKFLDTDHEVEVYTKYDISTIFEKFGEGLFRDKETEILNNLKDKENLVISTGGGIILKDENINLMKEIGTIVFLDINLETQIKRVKYRKHRPLLHNSNLQIELKKLKNNRDPIYNKISDYIIEVSSKDKNTIVDEIQKKLL